MDFSLASLVSNISPFSLATCVQLVKADVSMLMAASLNVHQAFVSTAG